MLKMLRIVSKYKGGNVSAQKSYFSGQYSLAAEAQPTKKDRTFVLGGSVFTGQHQRARHLYKDIQKSLTPEEQVIANFHMGISHVRTSEYDVAKKFFTSNLGLLRQKKLPKISYFFTYQGLSFYRYFFSRHRKSQKWADRGYAWLLKDSKSPPLLLALSLDIQGHNQIQLGRIHLGLSLLEQALSICKQNNLIGLGSEVEVSIYVYRSEYANHPKAQIANLIQLFKRNASNNDYSHSSLVLQVAKLFILIGQFQEANDFVTANYDVIYKNENKRNIAILNTLISQLLYKKGQFLEALSVAKIARSNLDEKIDVSLILPILTLEIKILQQMNRNADELVEYTNKISQKIDRHLSLRIYNRLKKLPSPYPMGEDKLGDLVERLHANDHTALEFVLDNEIMGLLPNLYKIKPGSKVVLVLEDIKHLILFDTDGIRQSPKLTRTQILFLKSLDSKGISKQKLIEQVWGYSYESLRHDSLIYSTVARLKKIFGVKKNWILSEETQYFLRDDVSLQFRTSKKTISLEKSDTTKPAKPMRPKAMDGDEFQGGDLNYRQLEILSDPPEKPLSVSEYAKMWKVTRMTSLRDLTALCDKNLASKIGRGKATRYYINA